MANLKFPKKTIDTMANIGITESDIWDVYKHGTEITGKNGMSRKYNGYEIGFFYVLDSNTGEHVITYAWKRDRR